jgi:hypothetical protein
MVDYIVVKQRGGMHQFNNGGQFNMFPPKRPAGKTAQQNQRRTKHFTSPGTNDFHLLIDAVIWRNQALTESLLNLLQFLGHRRERLLY